MATRKRKKIFVLCESKDGFVIAAANGDVRWSHKYARQKTRETGNNHYVCVPTATYTLQLKTKRG